MGIGLDETWEWPPIFSSILEMYSVRRYWGRFWHMIIYKSFSAHSATILWYCGMREKTAVSRFTRDASVFALSAAMHGAADWRMNPMCLLSRSHIFWFFQPVAFAAEGLMQHLWEKYTYRGGEASSKATPAVERVVGHLWAFAFMYWCMPKRLYPSLKCAGVPLWVHQTIEAELTDGFGTMQQQIHIYLLQSLERLKEVDGHLLRSEFNLLENSRTHQFVRSIHLMPPTS